jgi:two-component system nitrogen regulation response regulator NtrX
VRETAIVAVANARGRRALIDGLESVGWRVRVVSGDDVEAASGCREAGAKIAFVEWPAGDASDSHARLIRARATVGRIALATSTPVIATAEDPCPEDVVSAMKAGAADFLVLDAGSDSADETVAAALTRLLDLHATRSLEDGAGPIEAHWPGTSAAAVLMRSRLAGLAGLSGPVLVLGEAGSGRDTVARALHAAGPGPDAPFRKIDCDGWQPGDALPSTGTLYLDHVDRLRPGAQQYWVHRILELERRGFERGPRLIASAGPGFFSGLGDVAACDDAGAVGTRGSKQPESGGASFDPRLRSELMRYPLELVPLRDRLDDVPVIADAIVRRIGARLKREVRLTEDAHAFLACQGWPGNVAQLARLLERAVAFCASGRVDRAAMEQLMDDFEESLAAIRRQREIAERDELLDTLARTGGNISRCAHQMGRSRGAIYRLIQKYGIALPRSMKKVPPGRVRGSKATA